MYVSNGLSDFSRVSPLASLYGHLEIIGCCLERTFKKQLLLLSLDHILK